MKRPLAVFGGVFLAVMLVTLQLPAAVALPGMLVLLVVFAALLVCLLRARRQARALAPQAQAGSLSAKKQLAAGGAPGGPVLKGFTGKRLGWAVLVCGAACCALAAFLLHAHLVVKPVAQLAGQTQTATARVVQTAPGYEGETSELTLQILQLNGRPVKKSFTVVVTGYAQAQVGDVVQTELGFYEFSPRTARYNYTKGIYIGARAAGPVVVTGRSVTFLCRMRLLQYAASQNILGRLPLRLSSVATAMAVGDSRFLTAETKGAYRAAGLSHLLVVSGMHLSVLSGGVYALLHRVLKRRRWASAFSIVFILGFMAFTGFSPSVVRSGVGYLLVYMGNLFYRRADIYTSLGLAALLLCIQNPYAAADIGVLLSFSATLGALFGGRLSSLWGQRHKKGGGLLRRGLVKLVGVAIVPVVVTFATLPVLLLSGLGVSLYSIPVNILVLPLLGPVVVLGLVAALPFVPVVTWFGGAGALLCGALLVLLEKLTNFCTALPAAQLYIAPVISVALLLLYPLAMFAVKSRRFTAYALAGLAVLGLAVGLQTALTRGTVRATVVGSGASSSLVVCKGGKAAVIYRDRRSLYSVQTVLQQQNVKAVELFVDLRNTSSSTEYVPALNPARVVVANTDVVSRREIQVFEDVTVYILKQGEGMAAVVQVAGYTIGVATGKFNFALYGPLTVLVGGRSQALGEYQTLLCTGAPPEWAAPTGQLLASDGEPVILIRPGGGIGFTAL